MKKSDLHQTAINHTSHSHGFERLYLIFGMVLSFATASPLRRPHFGHVTRRSEHIDHILRPIARFPKSAHMYTHIIYIYRERERDRQYACSHVCGSPGGLSSRICVFISRCTKTRISRGQELKPPKHCRSLLKLQLQCPSLQVQAKGLPGKINLAAASVQADQFQSKHGCMFGCLRGQRISKAGDAMF